MADNTQPDALATAAAEKILRTIYGDDFTGCTVRLEDIAAIVNEALQAKSDVEKEVLDLYEKVVAAIQTLSSPPENAKTLGPNELRSLLGERLDAILTLAT